MEVYFRGSAGPAREPRIRVFEITNPRRARAFRLTPVVHEVRAAQKTLAFSEDGRIWLSRMKRAVAAGHEPSCDHYENKNHAF